MTAPGVTVVWLSPGLPADRAELASALPSDVDLTDDATDIGELAVGSLCVVTIFETDLIARLGARPDGVRLLVVGPEGRQTPAVPITGRAPEMVTSAASVGELAAAIQQAVRQAVPGEKVAPSARRGRLITAGAVLGALAIGGIVIASTEGATAASASNRFGGNFGGGNFGGGNFGGGNVGGGTGTQGGAIPPGVTAANGPALLACIQKKGFTGSVSQLLSNRNDPKLQQAFMSCLQQLGGSSSSGGAGGGAGAGTPSRSTGRP